jgi:hypothetical protein
MVVEKGKNLEKAFLLGGNLTDVLLKNLKNKLIRKKK